MALPTGLPAVLTRHPPIGLRAQALETLGGGTVETGRVGRETGAVGVDVAVDPAVDAAQRGSGVGGQVRNLIAHGQVPAVGTERLGGCLRV